MREPIGLCGLLGWLGNRWAPPLVHPSEFSYREVQLPGRVLEKIHETGERLGAVIRVAPARHRDRVAALLGGEAEIDGGGRA